jgi:hypothetical protein
VFFSLSGCSDGELQDDGLQAGELQGSCASITGSDGSKMCIEYYSSKDLSQWEKACGIVMRGSWSQAGCEKSDALGGCQLKDRNAILWLFPSGKYQTTRNVEDFCVEKERIFLPPS